jgi:uncharacterized membrane protein YkvA (DUF1232 family)
MTKAIRINSPESLKGIVVLFTDGVDVVTEPMHDTIIYHPDTIPISDDSTGDGPRSIDQGRLNVMLSLFKGPGRKWLQKNLPRVPLLVNIAWGLFRDHRVPLSLKAGILGVLAYVASPIDIIPDFIPGIGMVDDLVLLLAALEMFVRWAPADVVEEIESRYREGHGPLRSDLKNAEKHFGRLWSWALKKIENSSREYAQKVMDRDFIKNVERKTNPKAK